MRRAGLGPAVVFAVCSATAFGQGAFADRQIQAGQQAAEQGQHAEAARLFALAVQEAEKSGTDDQRLATGLTGLGLAFTAQRKFDEAEPVLQRAATVKEKLLGAEHPEVAGNLTNLGGRLRDQGKFAEAEPMLKRALAIRQKILRPDNPDVVRSMLGLANLYADQQKYAEAEPLLQRCVAVLDSIKAYGSGYPNLPDTLRLYAELLRNTGRSTEAGKMEARANALRPPTGQD